MAARYGAALYRHSIPARDSEDHLGENILAKEDCQTETDFYCDLDLTVQSGPSLCHQDQWEGRFAAIHRWPSLVFTLHTRRRLAQLKGSTV